MEKSDATKGNPTAGTAEADTLINTIRSGQDVGTLKSAVVRIVELRDPRFVEPLTGMLKSGNSNARLLGAWGLSAFGDPKAIDALKSALADPEAGVRNMATEALKRRGIATSGPAPAKAAAPAQAQAAAPTPAPAPAKKPADDHLDKLIAVISGDPDALNRAAAVKGLGEIRDMKALEGILEAVKDSDQIVRGAAYTAMVGFRKDPRVYDTLIGGLKDDDFETRGIAAMALGSIQDDRAFDPLLNALCNGRPELREKAAIALGAMGDIRAVDWLRTQSLKDEKPEVRKNAREALTMMARKVSEGLKDPDPDVREVTADQLGKIKDPYPVPQLIELLCDEEPIVRESAAKALGLIEDRSATPSLVKLLKDKRGYVRKNAVHALGMIKDPAAVDALVPVSRDEQWFVRVEVAWALGQIGGDKGLKPLMAMFNDPDRNVRQTAAEAVQRFKNIKVTFKPMPPGTSPPQPKRT